MKNMIARAALTCVGLVSVAAAAHAGAGVNGMAFLKVGVGTDAVGMGHAYASQVADATATYWNPAGLARSDGMDFLLMHNEFIADIRLEYAAVSRTFGPHGVGLSFNGLFTSDLEGRDEDGNVTGDVGYSDLAFTVGYAYRLSDLLADMTIFKELTAGFNIKYLREFIGDPGAVDDHVAQGLAFDVGAQAVMERLSLGAVVQNLGGEMGFDDAEVYSRFGSGPDHIRTQLFDPPLIVQGGATYRPGLEVMNGAIEVALEGRKVKGEDLNLLFGARYLYRDLGALSVGYRSGLDTEDLSFGLQLRKDDFRFGYAFVPFSDDLGNSHRVSLGYHLR